MTYELPLSEDLDHGAEPQQAEASGPMAGCLTGRYTESEMWPFYAELGMIEELDALPENEREAFLSGRLPDVIPEVLIPRWMYNVRAFKVDMLVGQCIRVEHEAASCERIVEFLNVSLPPIEWRLDPTDFPLLPLRKYLVVDVSIAAPVDEATGQAMVLDLFGGAIIKDHDLESWRKQNPSSPEQISCEDGTIWNVTSYAPIDVPFDFRIDSAIYVNVCDCPVGKGFYL